MLRKSRKSKIVNAKKKVKELDQKLSQATSESLAEITKQKEIADQTLSSLQSIDPPLLFDRVLEDDNTITNIEQRVLQIPALKLITVNLKNLEQFGKVLDKTLETPSPKAHKPKEIVEEPQIEPISEDIISEFVEESEPDEVENSADSFDSSKNLGVAEGFTITMPNFGDDFSDSDSDVAAIEIRDHYSHEELVDPMFDENSKPKHYEDSDSYSSDDGADSPPPKRQKKDPFVSSKGKGPLSSPMKKKPQKKKNRMGQNARRRMQAQQTGSVQQKQETPVIEEKPEELHPSWSARKKTVAIADFKGKKKTFDDDSD